MLFRFLFLENKQNYGKRNTTLFKQGYWNPNQVKHRKVEELNKTNTNTEIMQDARHDAFVKITLHTNCLCCGRKICNVIIFMYHFAESRLIV